MGVNWTAFSSHYVQLFLRRAGDETVRLEEKEGRQGTTTEWTATMNDISLKVAHYRAVIDENFPDLVKDRTREKAEFSSFHVAELIGKYQRDDPPESNLENAKRLLEAEADKKLKSTQRSVGVDMEETSVKIDLKGMETTTSIPSIESLISSFSEQHSRLHEELATWRKVGTASLIQCHNEEEEEDEVVPSPTYFDPESAPLFRFSGHDEESDPVANGTNTCRFSAVRRAFTYVTSANILRRKRQQN